MTSRSIADLRRQFYGGGTDVEAAALQAYVDAGYTFTDMLNAGVTLHPVANPQAGNYQLALSDDGKSVEVDSAGGATVTIPPAATVPFRVGTLIEVFQVNVGQVTITPGAGVTLQSANGLKSSKQFSSVGLRYRGADVWVVSGDVTV